MDFFFHGILTKNQISPKSYQFKPLKRRLPYFFKKKDSKSSSDKTKLKQGTHLTNAYIDIFVQIKINLHEIIKINYFPC